MEKFVEHDRKAVRQIASVWKEDVKNFDNKELLEMARGLSDQLNQIMAADEGELQDDLHKGKLGNASESEAQNAK